MFGSWHWFGKIFKLGEGPVPKFARDLKAHFY